jgi:hypothetical protein
MKTTHILRYNATIAVFGAVIMSSVNTMAAMLVNFALLMGAFVTLCHVWFQTLSEEYQSIMSTSIALSEAFLGKFDFTQIVSKHGILGGIILLSYLIVMMFLIMNMFVAVLNEVLIAVQNDPKTIPKDHEVIEYFMDILAKIFMTKKKQPFKGKDDKGSVAFTPYLYII